jgi:hypothetical protein
MWVWDFFVFFFFHFVFDGLQRVYSILMYFSSRWKIFLGLLFKMLKISRLKSDVKDSWCIYYCYKCKIILISHMLFSYMIKSYGKSFLGCIRVFRSNTKWICLSPLMLLLL